MKGGDGGKTSVSVGDRLTWTHFAHTQKVFGAPSLSFRHTQIKYVNTPGLQ